jgi:hypothetical protein
MSLLMRAVTNNPLYFENLHVGGNVAVERGSDDYCDLEVTASGTTNVDLCSEGEKRHGGKEPVKARLGTTFRRGPGGPVAKDSHRSPVRR